MQSGETAENYMKRSLRLAGKGLGRTSPNPMVGAVIVRNGAIVGQGYHKKAGGAHGEINAMATAGPETEGADLYINLEPCSHFGRTPPCVDAVIRAGIKRVFIAMEDPNPQVAGRGISRLREAGIEVRVGILEKEARRLNEVFIKYITTGMPFVTLKAATTLDGHIATKTGASRWITGERSRHHVHLMRSRTDSILVGIGTVEKDDPSLTTRLHRGKGKDPVRIVLDERLQISDKARALDGKSGAEVIVATTSAASQDRIDALVELGVTVLVFDSSDGLVPFRPLMKRLGEMEISSVMIEGGSLINASALREGVVDKIAIFYAPRIFGGSDSVNVIGGSGVGQLSEAVAVQDMTIRRLGGDFLVEGYINQTTQA